MAAFGQPALTDLCGCLIMPDRHASEEERTIIVPIVEERVGVARREVEQALVRVQVRVEAHEAPVEAALRREDVTVERIAIGRVVEAPPSVREEDGVLVVPVLEERLVVRTELFLKEELRIARASRTETFRQTVQLRAERAEVVRKDLHPTPTREVLEEQRTMTGTERSITAMFDSRREAEAARDRLIGLGLSSGDISIQGPVSETDATPAARHEERGFWASLFSPAEDTYAYREGVNRGGYVLNAYVPEGMEDEVIAVLEQAGAVDMDERTASWRQSGWRDYDPAAVAPTAAVATGTPPVLADDVDASRSPAATTGTATPLAATAGTTTPAARAVEGEEYIPVVEEQLRVGKREVGRGNVRVRSYVREIPVEEQVELRRERVTVERRPVARELAPGEVAAAFQERTIEAVEKAEEAVISKTAHVVEEIAVRKAVERQVETVRDTIHKTEVEIEDERRTAEATRTGLTGTDETLPAGRTPR